MKISDAAVRVKTFRIDRHNHLGDVGPVALGCPVERNLRSA